MECRNGFIKTRSGTWLSIKHIVNFVIYVSRDEKYKIEVGMIAGVDENGSPVFEYWTVSGDFDSKSEAQRHLDEFLSDL